MQASKFWKSNSSFNLKSLFSKKTTQPNTGVSQPKPKRSFKTMYKKLGVAGGLVVVLVGILLVLGFFFIIKPSYEVLASVNKLKGDKADLENSFKNQDIDGVKHSLENFRIHLNDLRQVRDHNFSWTQKVPKAKYYYADSEHFINAGLLLVDAMNEFIIVVEPFSDATGFKSKTAVEVNDPNAGSGLADAFSAWVKIMPEVAAKMDPVIEKFDKVGEEMEKVDASRYPESFRGVPIKSNIEASQQYLTKAKEFGPDIKAALTVVPTVLGVGGAEKRYAIIFHNDAELRPTGGFITSFATFKVINAKLSSDFTSNDAYSIDEIIMTTDTAYTSPFPKPLPPYRDFLKLEHTYSRDANFSPDFPTAMESWLWYYKFAGRLGHPSAKPLNGIIGIDTQVVKELLSVTGPVTLNGVTYDSNNVVLELEKIASLGLREQQGRKKVLGDLMEEMLQNMYKSEKNLWPKFVEAGIKLAAQKHVQGYILDDPKAQELVEKYNFGGRIQPYEKGDYSFVLSTNLSGDKNNLHVTKEVDHKINQENGKWMHEVAVNYTFNKPKPGFEILVTTYRDWVRVYAPAGAKLVSLEGSDASTESDKGEERGKVYFAGHITLQPNEKKTIKFKYELPANVIKGIDYNLYLQKQAGTHADKHNVTVNGKTQTVDLLLDKELTFRLN